MLTLKQTRRMVAKSRRRVWRLARRVGVGTRVSSWSSPDAYAMFLLRSVLAYRPAVAAEALRLDGEFTRRSQNADRAFTLASERAWERYRVLEKLPALDHGQDSDELLQDIADYYANAGPPCSVCGAEMDWVECNHCGGEGGYDNDALMEEDPLWYDGVEWERCDECQGKGGWWECYRAPHGGQ